MPEISLRSGEKLFDRLDRVYVRKSLEEITHSFEFSAQATGINVHDKVSFFFGTELITSGRVDSRTRSISEERKEIGYTGRSYARDLIDSACTTNYKNQPLDWIFRKIAGLFGIGFTLDPTVKTSRVKEFALTAESPWNKLAQEAANQGLIATSTNSGDLFLTKISKKEIPVILEMGKIF